MTSFRVAFVLLLFALLLPLLAGATPPSPAVPAAPAAQVLIVGTFHFANPGLDLHNMQADDVLAPARQQQITRVVEALARFAPTLVAVEWSAADADRDYAAFRAGELPASRNEVVQLGFRLAAAVGLDRVYGIDMPGEFPIQAVAEWAAANGQAAALEALMQKAGTMVAGHTAMLRTHSIGALLRQLNSTAEIAAGQAFYMELLRFGSADQQPGAELNAAWQARNFRICARLLQGLRPGDRAVVFYGQGHAHALQRCIIETPGVELVDPLDHLVD